MLARAVTAPADLHNVSLAFDQGGQHVHTGHRLWEKVVQIPHTNYRGAVVGAIGDSHVTSASTAAAAAATTVTATALRLEFPGRVLQISGHGA